MPRKTIVKKPTVGFYSFTCCEGCQVTFFQLEGRIPELLRRIRVVNSRLLRERNPAHKADIAFVEGSIISDDEVAELQRIRENSKCLIAYGACATDAGINAIRNNLPLSVQEKILVGLARKQRSCVSKISDFVKVDYNMRGCPVSEQEILSVMAKLLNGQKPSEPTKPVCFECKIRENNCLLLQHRPCFGPISNSGCNAPCPSEGFYCNACRGYTPEANIPELRRLLLSFSIPAKDIDATMGTYVARKEDETCLIIPRKGVVQRNNVRTETGVKR